MMRGRGYGEQSPRSLSNVTKLHRQLDYTATRNGSPVVSFKLIKIIKFRWPDSPWGVAMVSWCVTGQHSQSDSSCKLWSANSSTLSITTTKMCERLKKCTWDIHN